jgi:hypothetical protein
METQHRNVSDEVLAALHRGVWLVCVGVYLVVFVGGLLVGVPDLQAMLRAAGLTLATAVLGKLALSIVSRASQPAKQQPSAGQDRTVGSLVDVVSSPNVAGPQEPEMLERGGER